MGHDLDFMRAYQCVTSWISVFDGSHDGPEVPMDYMVPEGAEAVLALWLENADQVANFTMHPYESIMYWAKKWELGGKYIYG